MRFCLCLVCMGIALFLAPPAMSFCNVPRPRIVCAEYFASQLVVQATLVQTTVLRDKDDPEGVLARVYTLRVDRVVRGRNTGSISVYEGNDSGRATFDWAAGRKYLLFLLYEPSDKLWVLDGCGNSAPLSEANMALSEIAAIKAARGGGVIHGVVSEQALSTPIPGVRVEAQGTPERYAATTNEKGEFRMNVPAGQYVVRAAKNGFTFDTADFSYEDPQGMRIEPGGCAQVQFAQRPPARSGR